MQEFSLDIVDGRPGQFTLSAGGILGLDVPNYSGGDEYNDYFVSYLHAFGTLQFIAAPPFPGGPFGFNPPGSSAAPEPSTLGMLGFGLLMAIISFWQIRGSQTTYRRHL